MHDDATGCLNQLEIHWRRRARICDPDVYSVQLLHCVWSHRVSHLSVSLDSDKQQFANGAHHSGLLSHVIINGAIFAIRKISRGTLLPEDFDKREQWYGSISDTDFFRPLRSIPEFFKVDNQNATPVGTATEQFQKVDEESVARPGHMYSEKQFSSRAQTSGS